METNYQMTRSQLDILTEINKTHLNKNEIVYLIDEKKFLFWTGEEWSEYKANGGLNLNLYEFNKTLVSQIPVLEDFTEAIEIIQNILYGHENEHFMLLCKDISYYTVFYKTEKIFCNFETFGEAVITCAEDIGKVISVDYIEDQNAVEIWVRTEQNENLCMYLFNCESMFVSFGG